jgi:hypothetical protein
MQNFLPTKPYRQTASQNGSNERSGQLAGFTERSTPLLARRDPKSERKSLSRMCCSLCFRRKASQLLLTLLAHI